MEGQINIFDITEPDYHGATDEITRYSIEVDFENSIILQKHCNYEPEIRFKSCHEYFVKCPKCGVRTKYFKHCYEAMQAWNLNRNEYGRANNNI